MAKSIGYFGLRRGSTKSHTFSVVGGKGAPLFVTNVTKVTVTFTNSKL